MKSPPTEKPRAKAVPKLPEVPPEGLRLGCMARVLMPAFRAWTEHGMPVRETNEEE